MSAMLKPGVFVATIKPFSGSNLRPAEEDVNHLLPVILDVVAGACPNKRVLAGTVAQRAGMDIGRTYLCKFEEADTTDYGRQFRFSTIKEITDTNEILSCIESLGMPDIIQVVKNEPEATKSGHFTYPKGLLATEKAEFDKMSAKEQDDFLKGHSDIRTSKI